MDTEAITVAISEDNVHELQNWLDTVPDAIKELDADEESRLLHLAVHRDARMCLHVLLAAGVGDSASVRNSNGTELWVTAAGKGLWCLRALVQAGRTEQGEVQHSTWNTALHVICLNGRDVDLAELSEGVRLLLEVGASSMILNKADNLPVDLMIGALARRETLTETEAQACLGPLLTDMYSRERDMNWSSRIEDIVKHTQNYVHTTHLPRAHRRHFVNRDNRMLTNYVVLLTVLLRTVKLSPLKLRRKLADDVLRLLTRVVGYDSFRPAVEVLHRLFFLLLTRGHFPSIPTLLQCLRLKVIAPHLFVPMLHAVLSLASQDDVAEYVRCVKAVYRHEYLGLLECCSRPRDLQELCRASVYQYVRDHDVLFHAQDLPLPPGLKNYLVQF